MRAQQGIDFAQWTWASVIILNRPFLQLWEDKQQQVERCTDSELHPKRLCVEAAVRICDILSAYHDYLTNFPCDMVFPIVLAAAIMWQFSNDLRQHGDSPNAREQLDVCVRSLSIVSSCWKNAARYQEKLLAGTCSGLFAVASMIDLN